MNPHVFTELMQRGATVVATLTGVEGLVVDRPDGRHFLPATIHQGDLSANRSLQVAGNLVVTGRVLQGAKIRASGSVVVLGHVLLGAIAATGAVCLRQGCMDSNVVAGDRRWLFRLATSRLATLKGSLENMLAVLSQLEGHPAFRTMDLQGNLRPLMEILVERNFAAVPVQTAEAVKRCSEFEYMGAAVAALLDLLRLRFTGQSFLQLRRTEIEEALRLTVAAIVQLEGEVDRDCSLWVMGGKVSDSTLQATGSVHLVAGEHSGVTILGGPVVEVADKLAGGTVSAAQSIRVRSATDVTLQVGDGGEVCLAQGAWRTDVRIGTLTVRVPNGLADVVVRQTDGALKMEPIAGGVR